MTGAGRECVCDASRQRVVVELIIADPILKQVTEYVEGLGAARVRLKEAKKSVRGFRARFVQMKIGNKQNRAHRVWSSDAPVAASNYWMHSALSMVIASTGTF